MPKIAVIGKSLRENEYRLPIHPQHLDDIPQHLRKQMVFDSGYGEHFGRSDSDIRASGFCIEDRNTLMATSDIVVIAKPMEPDLQAIKKQALIWGWMHFVLYGHLADICIERKHTVLTWEAMFEADAHADRPRHIFQGNNELAGYAGTLHALGLKGLDGFYGQNKKIAVIGHGYAGTAAIKALQQRGFSDITAYVQRPAEKIKAPIDGVTYIQITRNHEHGSVINHKNAPQTPFWHALKTADIIINCSAQNPENPLTYLPDQHIHAFDHDCLIIDISCDPGMGFSFLKPTTFDNPCYQIGHMTVVAVDHTPAYLWDAATWQISGEVKRFLPVIMGGIEAIKNNPTLSDAIEINNGQIVNPRIISYQKRSPEYPFSYLRP